MQAIWAIGSNPRKRRRKGGKRARRRMTAKQLQFFGPKKHRRSRRGGHRAKRRSRRHSGAVAVQHRRRSRRGGSVGRRLSTSGAFSLLKAGAIGGAGAVLVDIGMGYASRALATAAPTFATPANADGTPNYGYYGVKAGVAILLGTYGGRIIPGHIAGRMAEGALDVLAYQFLRPMVPAGIALGYVNPAPTMRRVAGSAPGAVVAGAGRYLPLGAYTQIPVRGSAQGAGARAANIVNMVNR